MIILPLLAVLAQSVSVKDDEKNPILKFSLEDEEKIQKEFDDLIDTFAAANVNPTELYCSKDLKIAFEEQVLSIPGLEGRIINLWRFLGQYSISDDDFICNRLIDSFKNVA